MDKCICTLAEAAARTKKMNSLPAASKAPHAEQSEETFPRSSQIQFMHENMKRASEQEQQKSGPFRPKECT